MRKGDRKCLAVVGTAMCLFVGVATSASAQLVNPGFDDGPTGPVGRFADVVGQPFSDGFWGAESSDIVDETVCGTSPRTGPYMLGMNRIGLSVTQAWQAVNVTDDVPGCVEFSAWGNSCSEDSDPHFTIHLQTFNDDSGYPNATFAIAEAIDLDRDPETWEKVYLCAEIPSDTKWILAEVQYVNDTMGTSPGYVDDVELAFDVAGCCGATPVEQKSWGAVKELFSRPND